MIKADVITLIGESPEAHGIFDPPSEIRRDVFCEIHSVSRNEYYKAMENGLRPSFVFMLSDEAEYDGEKIAEYNGKRYRIVRTYYDRQRVELVVEEATVDSYYVEAPDATGST